MYEKEVVYRSGVRNSSLMISNKFCDLGLLHWVLFRAV
jgi:hypothetical protein